MTAFPALRSRLDGLAARGRLRSLSPARGHDFASNDYLGLCGSPTLRDAATHALLRGVPVGAGGSRLLRGNHPEHEALEAEAAAFFGAEAALYVGGGFQANLAIFSALPRPGDLILHDALIHASVHDGMHLSRADTRSFRHSSVTDAEDQARTWRRDGGRGRIWIAFESLYSMDGDVAPLADFATLARDLDAVLVVDEAHATGLYGDGRGLSHGITDCPIIALHTCGKALGVSGALITADQTVIDALVTLARPFIYATAPSPLDAALVRAALGALTPGLIDAAKARWTLANHSAADAGLSVTGSQIIPVIIGDDRAAMDLAASLQADGFDLRAIRPPTVPKGSARLRISVTGNVDETAIRALFSRLKGRV